jgi:hypothetical protein
MNRTRRLLHDAARVPLFERRSFWYVVGVLCVIAAAASIRRLVALGGVPAAGNSRFAVLDAVFTQKADLTRSHVTAGLILALAVPMQFSSSVRRRFPAVHRWLGRVLLLVGVFIGVTGYAMVVTPVGGWIEATAIVFYGTAFMAALMIAWWQIRRRDIPRHREWMLRAMGIVLGIATARPVMAIFFATNGLTRLEPAQFFGVAMWIGFTATAAAAELYIRWTRMTVKREPLPYRSTARFQGENA